MQPPNERIYRRTCNECEKPALTLDLTGDPKCPDHAEVFVAVAPNADTPDEQW
ncbi:MAG: hypothetical protein ACR2N2_07905 [Acidimicrobiia bacterium]